MDTKDYTKWTLEELLQEEKKMKKGEITTAVIIGFLIGIMIFGVAKNGFGYIYTLIPLILILSLTRNSKKHKENLKQVREEIRAKNA